MNKMLASVILFALMHIRAEASWFGRRSGDYDDAVSSSVVNELLIDIELAASEKAKMFENAALSYAQQMDVCSGDLKALEATVQQMRTALIAMSVVVAVLCVYCMYPRKPTPTPTPVTVADSVFDSVFETCRNCSKKLDQNRYKDFMDVVSAAKDWVYATDLIKNDLYRLYGSVFSTCVACSENHHEVLSTATRRMKSRLHDFDSSELPYHYPEVSGSCGSSCESVLFCQDGCKEVQSGVSLG